MPSYFDRFGPIEVFSNHDWRRLHQRGLSLEAVHHALATIPKSGTSAETMIYTDGHVAAVVNATTGMIVTLWWIP
jgi:hypothetical protein